MTSDLDIYRTANVLIREHGEDADLEAAQRADAMLEKGCLDGQREPSPLSAICGGGFLLVQTPYSQLDMAARPQE